MFKTEMHLHTAESSPCAQVEAAEMIRLYKAAGYSTVFVTDHFQFSTLDIYGDIPWKEKIDAFLRGYNNAKAEGDKIGLNILLGIEICFEGVYNHYLVYGNTEEFLYGHPDIHKVGIEKFSEIAHENGLFIAQAHPYRDGKCFPTPQYVDAFEAYNLNPRHYDEYEKCVSLAKENGLFVIGGTDAHRVSDCGVGGIETEEEIKTTEQFTELLKNGKVYPIRGEK